MNFTRFPANTTNIFPIANSKTGGQLLTEFNLRSRESVLTNESVKYSIGPSYCHSMDDFVVRLQQDELGVAISSTTLEITDGRALVNGHYVESLANVTVDLAEANRQLKSEGKGELKGRLGIGLRAMYSTEQTLSASLRVENKQNLMTGVQIVVLPIGSITSGNFVLPEDSPDNDELVTCHLKLAEFYYVNGQIRSIEQNSGKIVAISASRVGNFEGLLDAHYLTKDGLNPKKIYTLAGKSADGTTLSGKPTWCDSTDSLFVWQKSSKLSTTLDDPKLDQAEFGVMYSDGSIVKNTVTDETKAKDGTIVLQLPHKSVDGKMWNAAGKEEFYTPRILHLPQADYATGTAGTVSSSYTNCIKAINEKINNFYHLPKGRQRGYVDVLDARTTAGFTTSEYDSTDEHILPKLNPLWQPGDYVLVREDNTVVDSTNNLIASPSSIYVVLPPQVSRIQLQNSEPRYSEDDLPAGFDGVEIMRRVRSYPGSDTDTAEQVKGAIQSEFNFNFPDQYNEDFGIYSSYAGEVSTALRGMYKQMSEGSVYAEGVDSSTGNPTPPILLEGYEGTDQYYDYQDYVVLEVINVPVLDDSGALVKKQTHYYYFAVTNVISNTKAYSDPILLTGTIPLATEDTIGGFYNVSESNLDNGYVIRDSNGNLKLLDYSLLRSGVLAYQLGQNMDFGSGLSLEEIQNELDEYVNSRVAFRASSSSDAIEITINLTEQDSIGTLTIENIDSRWGTPVHVIFTGTANSNTRIDIKNCEKLKITLALTASDLQLESGYGPILNVYNSCLYYDATIIDYVHRCSRVYVSSASTTDELASAYPDGFNGFSNLSLWYEKLDNDDPDLLLNGMTVTQVNTPIIPEDIDFWSEEVINDNHYKYGLHSIELDPEGNLVGCGLYMSNESTHNIEFGKTVSAAAFTLPQGHVLTYPETSVTKQIKVTGDFITGYAAEEPVGYIIIKTSFTALSHKYVGSDTGTSEVETGTISFLTESEFVDDFISLDGLSIGSSIDGWESNSYHVFKGWIIG